MTKSTPLAPMISPDGIGASTTVRSPKTAELVAGTLRRMVVDGQLKDGDFLPNEAELMAHFGVAADQLSREHEQVVELQPAFGDTPPSGREGGLGETRQQRPQHSVVGLRPDPDASVV